MDAALQNNIEGYIRRIPKRLAPGRDACNIHILKRCRDSGNHLLAYSDILQIIRRHICIPVQYPVIAGLELLPCALCAA